MATKMLETAPRTNTLAASRSGRTGADSPAALATPAATLSSTVTMIAMRLRNPVSTMSQYAIESTSRAAVRLAKTCQKPAAYRALDTTLSPMLIISSVDGAFTWKIQ